MRCLLYVLIKSRIITPHERKTKLVLIMFDEVSLFNRDIDCYNLISIAYILFGIVIHKCCHTYFMLLAPYKYKHCGYTS